MYLWRRIWHHICTCLVQITKLLPYHSSIYTTMIKKIHHVKLYIVPTYYFLILNFKLFYLVPPTLFLCTSGVCVKHKWKMFKTKTKKKIYELIKLRYVSLKLMLKLIDYQWKGKKFIKLYLIFLQWKSKMHVMYLKL